MTGRLAFICAHIPRAALFADVGCDHGYCTKYALDHGLCERAYACDVSEACLEKARTLLKNEVAEGRCVPVCTDGLEGVPLPDCVLCAGLGGEEIVRILTARELPAHFVLQPMKNAEKVRRFLLARGARIVRDVTFEDGGKFYELICGSAAGGDGYNEFELRYGRDNLRAPGSAFLCKLRRDAQTVHGALRGAEGAQREALLARLKELEGMIDAIEERL